MKNLTLQQRQFADQINEAIKTNRFAPENLNEREREAVDVLIKNDVIKSEKSVDQILQERNKARQDLALQSTISKDPIAAAFNLEGRTPGFSGRSTAVLAGDLGATIGYQILNKDKVLKDIQARGTLNTKSQRFFGLMADKIPARYKFTKGAFKALASAGDVVAKPVSKLARSPIGRFEFGSAVAGTAGAAAGNIGYEAANAIAGNSIFYSMMEDISDLPYRPEDKLNPFESTLVATKNAAFFNAFAAGITPLFLASGKGLNKLFGTVGPDQRKFAEFAREKGLDAPLLGFLRGGSFSELARNFFKTIGVFPGISPIADKALLKTEAKTTKTYFDNVESIAPLYHQSYLGQELFDQMKKVYAQNVGAYDRLYKIFYDTADIAGNPSIMSMKNTVEQAELFLNRFRAELPDAFRAFDNPAKFRLTDEADPLNIFMQMVGSMKGKNITFKEFKGLNRMLNLVPEQTKYANINQEFAAIKNALELDANSFSKNLNASKLMQDVEFAARVNGAGGPNSVGGKEIINSAIQSGNRLNRSLLDANEAFARTMRLYNNEAYYLKRKLQKVDSNVLTGKGLVNFLGRTSMPKEELFKTFEDAVFASRSPSALKNFKRMVGAEKGFEGYSKQGEELFRASFSKFLHDAYIGSFAGKPLQGAIDVASPTGQSFFKTLTGKRALEVKPFSRVMEDAENLQALRRSGGDVTSRRSQDNLLDIDSYKFGPDDYRDFDADTFIKTLGIGSGQQARAAAEMLEDAYMTVFKDRKVARKAVQDLRDFSNHLSLLSNVPVTNSSTFIQRRLQLSGIGGLAGVAIGYGAGQATESPLLTALALLMVGRYAGRILVDPTLLRQVNNILKPEEITRMTKERLKPKVLGLGTTQKREAFAKVLNKLTADDDDFQPVNPKDIDYERITDYLNNKGVEIIKPNYGPELENIPQSTLIAMYGEELTQVPSEEQKQNEVSLYEGMALGAKQSQDVFEDPRLQQDLQSFIPEPQVQQQPIEPAGQVSSQQVEQLFPFDTTAQAIAQRRQNRG